MTRPALLLVVFLLGIAPVRAARAENPAGPSDATAPSPAHEPTPVAPTSPNVTRSTVDPAPQAPEPDYPLRPVRHPSRNMWHLALGGVTFSNLGTAGVGTSVAAGYGWELESVALRFLLDLNTRSSAFYGALTVSVQGYLLKSDTTPFLSGDFGPSFAKVDGPDILTGRTVSGFLAGLGAGVLFFRNAPVHLELGARYGYMLNTNALGHPGFLTMRVGLDF